jgi:uncharacterized protein
LRNLFRATVLLCLWAATVWAVDYTAQKPAGYVSDFAGVVDEASHQRLEAYCASLEQTTGVQLAIVTVPSLDGEPVDQVANDLFRKWGIGQKGKDNGALLLLAIADRRSRLELGYGLEPAITDGLAGDVLRSMQRTKSARESRRPRTPCPPCPLRGRSSGGSLKAVSRLE